MFLHPSEKLFLEKHADPNKTYIGHPPFFRFKDGRKYTADFYCKEDDTFIEVVGTPSAYRQNKDKYALMGIEFPLVKFEFFFFPNCSPSIPSRVKKATCPMTKYLLVMSDEEIAEWKQLATADGRSLVSWIRHSLNEACHG